MRSTFIGHICEVSQNWPTLSRMLYSDSGESPSSSNCGIAFLSPRASLYVRRASASVSLCLVVASSLYLPSLTPRCLSFTLFRALPQSSGSTTSQTLFFPSASSMVHDSHPYVAIMKIRARISLTSKTTLMSWLLRMLSVFFIITFAFANRLRISSAHFPLLVMIKSRNIRSSTSCMHWRSILKALWSVLFMHTTMICVLLKFRRRPHHSLSIFNIQYFIWNMRHVKAPQLIYVKFVLREYFKLEQCEIHLYTANTIIQNPTYMFVFSFKKPFNLLHEILCRQNLSETAQWSRSLVDDSDKSMLRDIVTGSVIVSYQRFSAIFFIKVDDGVLTVWNEDVNLRLNIPLHKILKLLLRFVHANLESITDLWVKLSGLLSSTRATFNYPFSRDDDNLNIYIPARCYKHGAT